MIIAYCTLLKTNTLWNVMKLAVAPSAKYSCSYINICVTLTYFVASLHPCRHHLFAIVVVVYQLKIKIYFM